MYGKLVLVMHDQDAGRKLCAGQHVLAICQMEKDFLRFTGSVVSGVRVASDLLTMLITKVSNFSASSMLSGG